MGFMKNHLIEIEDRGYADSDKFVCSEHFDEKYIKALIKCSHSRGKCSFCGHRRNVIPFNDLLDLVTSLLNRNYLPAYDNAEYDNEEKEFLDDVTDTYDYVHYELPEYLGTDDKEILNEICNKVFPDVLISIDHFIKRREEEDLEIWAEYCGLVNSTLLSAEQIISISNKKDNYQTDSISQIRSTLDMIWDYCKELFLTKTEFGLSSQYSAHDYYRCVNHLPLFSEICSEYSDLNYIPATLVGTAPAKYVENNRMSEKGDMMFYASDDKKTALIEAGPNIAHKDYPATLGIFNSNKRLFLFLIYLKLITGSVQAFLILRILKREVFGFFLKNLWIESLKE